MSLNINVASGEHIESTNPSADVSYTELREYFKESDFEFEESGRRRLVIILLKDKEISDGAQEALRKTVTLCNVPKVNMCYTSSSILIILKIDSLWSFTRTRENFTDTNRAKSMSA